MASHDLEGLDYDEITDALMAHGRTLERLETMLRKLKSELEENGTIDLEEADDDSY